MRFYNIEPTSFKTWFKPIIEVSEFDRIEKLFFGRHKNNGHKFEAKSTAVKRGPGCIYAAKFLMQFTLKNSRFVSVRSTTHIVYQFTLGNLEHCKWTRMVVAANQLTDINRAWKFGQEPWYSGYWRRLMFWRLWVRIPALYTGFKFVYIDLWKKL